MTGIDVTGIIRNPLNKNQAAENPKLEIQPFLTYAGKLEINGAIVENETRGAGESAKIFESSRNGFTITEISAQDMEEIQEHYNAIVTKCKAIVAKKFKDFNPTATFNY